MNGEKRVGLRKGEEEIGSALELTGNYDTYRKGNSILSKASGR